MKMNVSNQRHVYLDFQRDYKMGVTYTKAFPKEKLPGLWKPKMMKPRLIERPLVRDLY